MLNRIPRGSSYFSLSLFRKALVSLLEKTALSQNKQIEKFEKEFAKYIGTRYAIAVSSGKLGLYLSLKLLGLKPEDEVIMPAFAVPEVVEVIENFGVVIKFVDILTSSYNIDPSLIEENITGKTKAIVMIHMFGQPANIEEISEITKKYNLYLIEDCAQSIGAEYKGERIGRFGNISYFSFGILKDINTLGGGMIATNDEKIASRIKKEITRYPGQKKFKLLKELVKTMYIKIFTNSIIFNLFGFYFVKITTIFSPRFLYELFKSKKLISLKDLKIKYHPLQAKLGLEQLKTLDEKIDKRRKNVNLLTQKLKVYKLENLELPQSDMRVKNTFYRYPVKYKKRDIIIKYMIEKGVDLTTSYTLSFHSKQKENQNAKILEETNILLPIDYTLTKHQICYIAKSFKFFFSSIN